MAARSTRFWKAVAAVAVAALAADSYAIFHVNEEQQAQRDRARVAAVEQSYNRDVQIRQGQIQNCNIIGEPIRHAQIRDAKQTVSDIKKQRQQSKAINYHDLFPQYDAKQLHALIAQGKKRDAQTVAAEQSIIDTLQNVPPCEQRYPEPLPPTPVAP